MTLQQPMNLQALCYTAAEDRQALQDLVCGEGVVNVARGDFFPASTLATDHSVSLAAGSAYVENNDATDAGMYRVRGNAAEVVQIPVGGGGLIYRLDTIILRVRDAEYSGLDNDAVIEVVAGTDSNVATIGATGTTPTPAAFATVGTVPDNALVLGYARVLPADTLTSTLAAGDVFDARKAYMRCGGQPILRMWRGNAQSTAAAAAYSAFLPDGVSYNTFGPGLGAGGLLFDTTTGEFTAPAVGIYRVSWNLSIASAGATDWLETVVLVNAVGVNQQTAQGPITGAAFSNQGSIPVRITTAGHKIKLNMRSNAARALAISELATWLSIEKVG